jgi:sRNA-binding carbon storage regulator CsrA
MHMITRHPDEAILIGDHMTVTVTDVDKTGIRIMIEGELIGGPDDGLPIHEARELGIGSEVRLGDLVTLSVANVRGTSARLGVVAPAHVAIRRKEMLDQK